MFSELFDNISGFGDKEINLVEALTKKELDQLRDELSSPEILTCDFDVSIPGWIERIKLWGTIIIHHKNPEEFRGKKKVTIGQFISKLQSEDLKKLLSRWYVEKKGLTKVRFLKDYLGSDNKAHTEEFIINVKLKPELRGLKLW